MNIKENLKVIEKIPYELSQQYYHDKVADGLTEDGAKTTWGPIRIKADYSNI